MKRFFNETEWTKIKELKDVQDEYDIFPDDIRTKSKGIRSIL